MLSEAAQSAASNRSQPLSDSNGFLMDSVRRAHMEGSITVVRVQKEIRKKCEEIVQCSGPELKLLDFLKNLIR